MQDKNQKGMTLVEISVVLLVLIALAGLAMPYVVGTSSKALCEATDLSMANIKRAIMDRYYLDTLGHFPVDKGRLKYGVSNPSDPAVPDYNLHYLFVKDDGIDNDGDGSSGFDSDDTWQDFDPDSQVGWRGPYLQNGLLLANTNDVYKASNLSNNFKDTDYVNLALADGHYVVLDSWGRPIIIQVTDTCSDWNITTTEKYCARLVSAGSGNGLGLADADIETPIAGHRPDNNDDRILYLNAPTPAEDINRSCSDY